MPGALGFRRSWYSWSPSSAASSTPVSVTVCAVFQFAGVNVSVVCRAGAASPAFDTWPSPSSALETRTVTFAVGSLASFSSNVSVLPAPISVTER